MTSKDEKARQLTSQLWSMANNLRGKMDASEYRDYILGFIFYRYLSYHQERYLEGAGVLTPNPGESVNDTYVRQAKEEGLEDWREEIAQELGYAIDPDYTWESLVHKVNENTIRPEDFNNMLERFKANSRLNDKASADFQGVFDNINLGNSSLGNSTADRARSLAELIRKIDKIDFMDESGRDILGNVYEYLIAQFAGNSGKKAGEFYTPHTVSRILAKLVTYVDPATSKEDSRAITNEQTQFSVYDPTMGSGSLLLTVSNELPGARNHPDRVHFYGQEQNSTTYNLARMNLMMHGVGYKYMNLNNADTLESDWPDGTDANGVDHPLFFDAVVANPPYSQQWENKPSKMKDPRFKDYGKLAPKSKADFAFVEHSLYHLKPTGRMAIVLPHGVLFRGAAEGTIRKAILEKNWLDAVIGLPANLFYSTGIPTTILVFTKNKKNNDILFIDASQHFEKGKNQNNLRDEDIDLIFKTYADRKEVDRLAHVATIDEIRENDYNLNIPRYVDTFEEEEPIDLDEVNRELSEVDAEIARLQAEFDDMAKDLVETETDND